MTTQDAVQIAAVILVALGGGGGIVAGLSGWLGKVWSERLMLRERADHDKKLEALRAELRSKTDGEIEHIKASLAVSNTKVLGAHADKVLLYRMVVDIVAEMMADIFVALGGRQTSTPTDATERMYRFDRDRLRAYGYLAMFAPQHVMDSFDRVIDHLFAVLEGSANPQFVTIRELGIAMLNEIRIDLGVDPSPIAYRGVR